MATHSGTLAWEISWTEEPGDLQSKRVKHDLATKQQQILSSTAKVKLPLQNWEERTVTHHYIE